MKYIPSQTSPLGLAFPSEREASNTEAIHWAIKWQSAILKLVSSGELDLQHLGRVIMPCRRFFTYLPCWTWCYPVQTEAWLNSPALLPSRLEFSILDHACEPAHHFVLLWEPHTRTSKKENRREWEGKNGKERMEESQTRAIVPTIFKPTASEGSKLKDIKEETECKSPGISVFPLTLNFYKQIVSDNWQLISSVILYSRKRLLGSFLVVSSQDNNMVSLH